MCHLVSGRVDAVTTFKMLSSCWNNILTIYRFQCFCIYLYEKYPECLHYCWFILTFTTLWAHSTDDKLILYMIFYLIFPIKYAFTFHADCLQRQQFA